MIVVNKMTSVTEKASRLLNEGRVHVENPTFSKLKATVVTKGSDGVNEHDVIIWKDGHFTCTCTNFIYSKSESVDLWGEQARVKPECKHALAIKLTPEYKTWIRMIVVPTNDGFALRSVEFIEDIDVKSLDDEFSIKKLLPKVKKLPLPRGKRRISFDDVFDGDRH